MNNGTKICLSLVLLVLLAFTSAAGQEQAAEDLWAPFRYFVGEWSGQGEGMSGVSKGELVFAFILDGAYLHMTNVSVFEPQEKNPEGQTHRDWGVFSYDRGREKFVLRQFHSEGFVILYTLEGLSRDGKTFTFVSDNIENGAPGMLTKLVYEISSGDEFQLSFFLAMPGQELACYSQGVMTRTKRSFQR